MTISRNNVGVLNTIVKPCTSSVPSFVGEKYKPTAYLFDVELNEWVSFYWIDAAKYRSSSGGAQCCWLDNNAEIDNENHFGIKLTGQNHGKGNAKSAALAMYQRQKLAAEYGYAPPVHGMCCVKRYDKDLGQVITLWGYLSCRAMLDEIDNNPEAEAQFEEYVEECRNAWEKHEELEEHLNNLDWISSRTQSKMLCYAEDDVGYPHPDYISYSDWCNENDIQPLDIIDLYNGLSELDTSGLQHDFFEIGHKYPDNTYMGHDLHRENVGIWQGYQVCIDFGYHCVGENNRCSYV